MKRLRLLLIALALPVLSMGCPRKVLYEPPVEEEPDNSVAAPSFSAAPIDVNRPYHITVA